MESLDYGTDQRPARSVVSRFVMISVVVGFCSAFVALLVFQKTLYSNGTAIFRVSLWEYYKLELAFLTRSPRLLGAKEDSVVPILTVLIRHVIQSLAGGVIGGVAAMIIRRAKK